MLHNFEEYGIDAMGRAFHFPVTACDAFGFGDDPSCPLTPAFFTSVNVPIVWFGMSLAAFLARRMPAIGLVGAGVMFTNALSHISTLANEYTPGTVTSIAIFLPLSMWIFVTQFGRSEGRLPYLSLVTIFVASILAQGVLLGLLSALSSGSISESAAIAVQTLDPVVLLGLPWLVQRLFPATARPRVAASA
ncbi:MAG: HXXEE domain-containing protein [Dactylosporangium sp.]|nr:HXXEE domain-containing protein [Dactylosporangium sp.]